MENLPYGYWAVASHLHLKVLTTLRLVAPAELAQLRFAHLSSEHELILPQKNMLIACFS
ncbi:hypothetical protein KBC79_05670 [Candidatus Woesebacteria bacterium]|nr:hypothetical protein [Candidatus Woesebacteria bacterium]